MSTKISRKLAGQQLARQPPLGAERRDERHQHDQSGIDHQPGHFGDAPDVLDPVGIGEAEVAVEAVADVVAVEQIGVAAGAVSRFSTQSAIVDLPEPDRPVNHSTPGRLALDRRARALSTSSSCQGMLAARRKGKRIMPAPTVALVSRSIRMKPPVSRLSS